MAGAGFLWSIHAHRRSKKAERRRTSTSVFNRRGSALRQLHIHFDLVDGAREFSTVRVVARDCDIRVPPDVERFADSGHRTCDMRDVAAAYFIAVDGYDDRAAGICRHVLESYFLSAGGYGRACDDARL